MGNLADPPTPAAPGSTAPPLGPELTIPHAAELREQLLRVLAAVSAQAGGVAGSAAELVLDLSDVSDCDSSGVQLLLATHASLALRGQALRLQSPSQAVCAALATFGLGGWPATAGSTPTASASRAAH